MRDTGEEFMCSRTAYSTCTQRRIRAYVDTVCSIKFFKENCTPFLQ